MTTLADIECTMGDAASFPERLSKDGVFLVRGVLDAAAMEAVEAAYNDNLSTLGSYSQQFYPGNGTFLQSVDDSSKKPTFQAMYKNTPVVEIAKAAFGSDGVWHYEDQLFFKESADKPTRRTPWHQDTSYHPMDGDKIAVLWMPLDDVTEQTALEVIPGTHKGVLFNGSVFDPEDDTTPVYKVEDMPRLPDIEADRDKWDIVTCAMKRGDVLVFHTSTLHGGGPTPPHSRRRSLSLRLVGDNVVRAKRPDALAEVPEESGETVSYEGEYDLQTRISRLPIGEPIYKAGLTQVG